MANRDGILSIGYGYPNLFMVLGPNGPFTNLPPSIETQVDWIADLIRHAQTAGVQTVEATLESERRWTALCRAISDMTLFPKADSWIFGANIPGKTNAVMFYLGGLRSYRQKLGEEVAAGYGNFLQRGPIVKSERRDPSFAPSARGEDAAVHLEGRAAAVADRAVQEADPAPGVGREAARHLQTALGLLKPRPRKPSPFLDDLPE